MSLTEGFLQFVCVHYSIVSMTSVAVVLTPVVVDWVLYLVLSLESNWGRLISLFGSSSVSVMPGTVNLGIS